MISKAVTEAAAIKGYASWNFDGGQLVIYLP